MTATEQQVKMAAKLYECRDTAKTLLGDRYKARMAELGDALKAIAAGKKCELLHAANLAARACDSGFDQVQVLAAAVELVEPSC